jgi:transposase
MRGRMDHHDGMFVYVSPDSRVPADHPLRAIRLLALEALGRLSERLSAVYSHTGRPSIPPERLLLAQLLIALYSVRSDRQFCEQLDYNILFRWFLGMDLEEPSFDASTFSRNRQRFLESDLAGELLSTVVELARERGLLSDEHFSVDTTLVDAWASMKSVRPIGEARSQRPKDGDPGNPSVDWHGERRSNATHRSTTDGDARLFRASQGTGARLCHMGHTLMDHRHGLVVAVSVTEANGRAPFDTMFELLGEITEKGARPRTLAADKGYHTRECVSGLRESGIAPHIARRSDRRTPGLDDRTTRHDSYRTSQRIRKRIEEGFGWLKVIGGMRKSRFRGRERTAMAFQLATTALNLLRIARLAPA